ARGVHEVAPNLWVQTPLVLPFPHSRVARVINRTILRRNVARLCRKLGFDSFQLWFFIPASPEYVKTMGESCSVYYCVDEWSAIPGVDAAQTRATEAALCRKVDVVFCTSERLL